MSTTADREIVITRRVQAPRALVYRAFTEPRLLAQWWGPKGFTNTFKEIDIRPGGRWRFVMHGPGGADYPNRIVFIAVEPELRLEYAHSADVDDDPMAFHVVTTFLDEDGGTRVTLRMTCATAEQRDEKLRYGVTEGGRQTMDRLEEQVQALLDLETHPLPSGEEELVLTRVLRAPPARVWEAWTRAEQLCRWWGPGGARISSAQLELRAGGLFHYSMAAPDGSALWGRLRFLDVDPIQRLVFVSSFSDEGGGVKAHPMAPTFPKEIINVLTLADEQGGTRLTLRGGPFRASPEERATYAQIKVHLEAGMGGTLAALERLLSEG